MSLRVWSALVAVGLVSACQPAPDDGDKPPTNLGGDDVVDTDVTVPADTDVEDSDVGDTNTTVWDSDEPEDTATDTSVDDTAPPQDTAAPMLEVFEPAHGTWLPEGPIDLTGKVTDANPFVLTVDGVVTTPNPDGTFASTIQAGIGTRILETTAVDDAGNVASDARAVMIGQELPPGDALNDAMLIRLDEGAGGIDTLEGIANGLITPGQLAGLIPNPVINQSQQSCINIPFIGQQCVTWYSLALYVDSVNFSDFLVDIDPKAAGDMLVSVTVNNLDIGWHANGAVTGIGQSFSGHMTADAIVVTLDVTPSVTGGVLGVAINGSSVDLYNFQAGLPGWINTVAGIFGIDVNVTITDLIKTQLDAMVRDQLPGILSGALGSIAAPISLDVAGVQLDLLLTPSSIGVDETGITLGLGLSVTATPDSAPNVGSLYAGWSAPSFPGVVGARLAISLDGMNQILRGVWAAGIGQIGTLLGGGQPIDVSLLFPTAPDATLGVASPLPPVMLPIDAAQAEFQIGDLDLQLLAPDQSHFLDAWTSIRASVTATMANDTIALHGTPIQIAVDLEGPLPHQQPALEQMFEQLGAMFLPALLDQIGAFPLPAIAGFGFTNTTVTFEGPEHGYLMVSGQLQTVP